MNIGDASWMKIGRGKNKRKLPEGTNSEIQLENIPEKREEEDVVFKWHYPLLIPYSRAAIVEDAKGDIKYLLLEPTLTAEDKLRIKQIEDIL